MIIIIIIIVIIILTIITIIIIIRRRIKKMSFAHLKVICLCGGRPTAHHTRRFTDC